MMLPAFGLLSVNRLCKWIACDVRCSNVCDTTQALCPYTGHALWPLPAHNSTLGFFQPDVKMAGLRQLYGAEHGIRCNRSVEVAKHTSTLMILVMLTSDISAILHTQGAVDAKTGELAESAHRNVQLGARVRSAPLCVYVMYCHL